MKTILKAWALCLTTIILMSFTMNHNHLKPSELHTIKINSLMGEAINLADFKGKKILFVNVASECGFTPQYADLQKLSIEYGDRLVIIGVPCNQFGGQEPGDKEEIASFCKKNYGVTFLMTEKVDVKGNNQHPLYSWLTQKSQNKIADSEVKWNFQKYLVDENGNYIEMFLSDVNPLDTSITDQL